MLKRILFSWLVNFLGLWVAVNLFSGISYNDQLRVLIIASLIFGIINSLVRPLIIILSLPAIVLTFGLFTLIINASMLYVTSFFYPRFQIKSIWSAAGAVVILWIVNYLMTDLIGDKIS
ncbi:MAG: phage holin family protein [bacterium]|nr:phage holin family protein [bacterium]